MANEPAAAFEDVRVRTWNDTARYHREHGKPIAGNLAADVADAIRFYLIHRDSAAFTEEAEPNG